MGSDIIGLCYTVCEQYFSLDLHQTRRFKFYVDIESLRKALELNSCM